MNVIEVTNLVKRYGDQVAVDDVSFAVEAGRDPRDPRPERRRQDHDRRVDQRPPDARLGRDQRARPRPATRSRRAPRDPRRAAPGNRAAGEARESPRRSGCTPRSIAIRPTSAQLIDGLGIAEKREHGLQEALGRSAPAPLDRARPRRQPEDRDPRRADDRPRPAGPPRHVGAHRGRPRPRRDRSSSSPTSWRRPSGSPIASR